ncbi:MAG: hypothetical protein ABI779_09695 [Acidobacteriota bacterium]
MHALLLLLTITTSTIVLRSGDQIAVDGSVRQADGVVTFRSRGLLYSLPAEEVERIDTVPPPVASSAGSEVRPAEKEASIPAPAAPATARRLTDAERKRLIAELEKNHSGQPRATLPPVVEVTPAPGELKEDEAYWRSQARAREESVRRAEEELALLETRAGELRDQIHALVHLGYQPRQFTYQTTQLAYTEEQLPRARLEVTRAERAWQQFREDARRAGVLPGWLR